MANATVVVPPLSEIVLPVSCLEKKRWHGDSIEFRTAGRALRPCMRSSSTSSVALSLVRTGMFTAAQGQVWNDVARYAARRGVHSHTMALSDVVERDRPAIEEFLRWIRPLPGQTGLLALVNGRFAGLDVMGRPEAYAVLHDLLVRSSAAEAVERLEEPPLDPREPVHLVLEALRMMKRTEHTSPGTGVDVRLHGLCLTASALVLDEGVVHLSAFPV